MSDYSKLFGGGEPPVGAIISGQFNNDTDFLPCDGYPRLVSDYPALDKTGLGTFGSNVAIARSVLSQNWGFVVYGGGQFVAVGQGASTATDKCATSPDGITWTTRTMAASKNWYGVIYAAGLFVAWATDGAIQTSPDGITWTSRTGVGALGNAQMAYGAGLFVVAPAGSTGNTYYTSPDGITWTTRTNLPGSAYICRGVSYAAGRFWITTDNAALNYVSSDGVTWASHGVSTSITYAYKYFTVGNILYSGGGARSYDNGVTWVLDATLLGCYFEANGFLFTAAGGTKYTNGNTLFALPGIAGWSSFSACIANSRIVYAYGTSLYTLDFDTTKFRTPFGPATADTDRFYIKAR